MASAPQGGQEGTLTHIAVTSDGPSAPIPALSPTCRVTNPRGEAVDLCEMVPLTQCGTMVDTTGVLSRARLEDNGAFRRAALKLAARHKHQCYLKVLHKRPLVVDWISLSSCWSEILALIRVEMKDLLYIQALLNGTWQKRGSPAFLCISMTEALL